METMQVGQITAPRKISMIELPVPDIEDGQILVKLEAAAICGSDIPYYLMDPTHPSVAGAVAPLPPFYSLHELVGHVAKSRCDRFKEGDRVLALPFEHRGMAEYFLSAPEVTVPIPSGPADRLVLSQPLGTVVHACLKLPNVLGHTAVVLGQGPIGQLFTALLRRMGVHRLIAVDILPERLEVSRKMGATHTLCGGEAEVLEAVRDITGGKGADLAIEAVGYGETLNQCCGLVRRNGTVLAFGVPHSTHFDFAFRSFFFNEGRMINSIGPDVQYDFPIAVDMVASGAIDVSPLITHTFPFSEADAGFDLFADRRDGVIKAILTT
ncbi:MAG: tdh 2 [Armatimonadetes bacterium]|jgi:L-iditol 2-dehydrogenase|nr:tdh 2 [Armatimonadota bacterium]